MLEAMQAWDIHSNDLRDEVGNLKMSKMTKVDKLSDFSKGVSDIYYDF